MADALRGNKDAAEYKYFALGLTFLDYISGAVDEHHVCPVAEQASGAKPEHPDNHRARYIFRVLPDVRRLHLKDRAQQPTIVQLVGDAMTAIERHNPALMGVTSKDYARPRARQDLPRAADRSGHQYRLPPAWQKSMRSLKSRLWGVPK